MRNQAVANPAHGDDEPGVIWVVLHFYAEPSHVGIHEAAVAEVVVTPHPLKELLA